MPKEIVIKLTTKYLIIFLILIVLIIGGAGFLYQGLKNNQQANHQPQAASIVTAPIVRQTLQESQRGTGHIATERSVAIGVLQGAPSVITRDSQPPGAQLVSGDVLTTIDERPLFIFSGAVPAYRDLGPGARGEDVAQIQQTLVHLGYPVWDELGYYGRDTAYAIYRFYLNSGYYPPDDVDQSQDLEAPYNTRLPRTEYVTLDFETFQVESACGIRGQTPSNPLCTVSDGTYSVYFEAEANTPAGKLEPGQTVVLEPTGHEPIEGILGKPVSDEIAQNIIGNTDNVEAEAPSKTLYSLTFSGGTHLTPEQDYAAKVIIGSSAPNALTVPESALVHDDDTTSVVLAEDSRHLPVTLGYCYRGYCELINPDPSLVEGTSLELASTEVSRP